MKRTSIQHWFQQPIWINLYQKIHLQQECTTLRNSKKPSDTKYRKRNFRSSWGVLKITNYCLHMNRLISNGSNFRKWTIPHLIWFLFQVNIQRIASSEHTIYTKGSPKHSNEWVVDNKEMLGGGGHHSSGGICTLQGLLVIEEESWGDMYFGKQRNDDL